MKSRLAAIGVFGPMSAPTFAAAAPPDATSLAHLILGLVVVLALIFVGAWFLKRYGRWTGLASGAVRVLGGVSLGPSERAVLLQVGGTQLLVGVAPGRVQILHVLDGPATSVVGEQGGGMAAAPTPAGFSQRLAELIHTARSS